MGSYASIFNDTNWPVTAVCISHLAGDNKRHLRKDNDPDPCLMPGESWNRGRDTLSLRLTGHGTIVGDYDTKKAFTVAMWTGPTNKSEKVHKISDIKTYKEVEPLLNRIAAQKEATASGISDGEHFYETFKKLSATDNVPKQGSYISIIHGNEGERDTVAIIKSVSEEVKTDKVTVEAAFGVLGGLPKTSHNIRIEVEKGSLHAAVNNGTSLAFDGNRTATKVAKACKPLVMLRAATLVLDAVTSVLSLSESPAPKMDYGVIAPIVFKEAFRAISEDNFSKMTADTATALTKLQNAMNHFEDKDNKYFIKLLMDSEEKALHVCDQVAVIGFPPEFEWWRPIIYMQLTTVRLVLLLNLHVLETKDNSGTKGFLASAQQCSKNARIVAAALIQDSKTTLLQWFKNEIENKFDSSGYEHAINQDCGKINALKTKFERAWANLLDSTQNSN